MIISKLNKYLICSIFYIILFGFACSDETENDAEINKLEYLGYEYLDQKVKVFLKNYSSENYSITLNSLAPSEEISSKGIIKPKKIGKPNPTIFPKSLSCFSLVFTFIISPIQILVSIDTQIAPALIIGQDDHDVRPICGNGRGGDEHREK